VQHPKLVVSWCELHGLGRLTLTASLVLAPLFTCSSPWQMFHSPGSSNILGFPLQLGLGVSSPSQLHTSHS
jgi:hypothetical protein